MKEQPTQTPDWPLRLVFVLGGLGTSLMGLFEIHQGYGWNAIFDARFGKVGFVPSLWFVVLGAAFFLFGLLPWRRISHFLEKKDPLLRNPRRRH